MRNHRTSILFAALAASFTMTVHPAVAQTSQGTDAQRSAPSANATYRADRKAARSADDAWQRTHRASKIIGTEVRNPQGQKVGTVKDLVIDDPQSGRISEVVVAVGGVLGMGDKLFAVPFDQLRMDPNQKYVTLSRSNDLAQTFDEKHWPQAASRASADANTTANSTANGVAMSPSATSSPATPGSSTASSASSPPSSGASSPSSASNAPSTTSNGTSSSPSTTSSASSSASADMSSGTSAGGSSSTPGSNTDTGNAGTPPSSSSPATSTPH